MAKFSIWAKADVHPSFERVCEVDQVVVTGTDNVRDQISSQIASKWMEENGNGMIEFRNAADAVLVRITRP